MKEIAVLNMQGQEVSKIKLNEEVFGIEPNKTILHSAVVNHLANCRQGTQSTLTRTEVRGGGRKPWRQKGTGHARQGSTRSPQWTHGGVALGPKPRDYKTKLNKKERALAIKSALSAKVLDKELIVVDSVTFDDYKTKKMLEFLKNIGALKKSLLILNENDKKVVKSGANIENFKVSQVGEINVYDILNNDKLILVESAVKKIEEVYAK